MAKGITGRKWQNKKQQMLEAEGIPYLLARSVDDVITFLGIKY